ncbi:uncharacterized protein LOC134240736 [Saccostrea cucullata]|uniref:uncharacterized protein LOC134240736 n=1 Tax=Saccostrea cuccullata TaxID=36930 RepID=UPI002ED16ED6
MPKRKANSNSQPTPRKGQRRGRGPRSANAVAAASAVPSLLLDPSAHDHSQLPVSNLPASPQPAVLTADQLRQVTESVADLIKESQGGVVEPASSPILDETSGDTIISSACRAAVPSYDNELGHNVPNNVKIKIANGEYINLGILLNNIPETDPNDDTKYFSLKDGKLAVTNKPKAKPITDIQVWTDAFLIFSTIYASAHPHAAVSLLKYMHTIRLGASRIMGLGWRDYDIQFRLKKERNPVLSFAVVDQELWLLYMYNRPMTVQTVQGSEPKPPSLKCYDFNYKGTCPRQQCQYSHTCILCSQPHPHNKHKDITRSPSNLVSANTQSAWCSLPSETQAAPNTYNRPASSSSQSFRHQ